jgi:hypothetical protein
MKKKVVSRCCWIESDTFKGLCDAAKSESVRTGYKIKHTDIVRVALSEWLDRYEVAAYRSNAVGGRE